MERECKGCGAILRNENKCPYCGRTYESENNALDNFKKIKEKGYYVRDFMDNSQMLRRLNSEISRNNITTNKNSKNNTFYLILAFSIIIILIIILITFSIIRSDKDSLRYKSDNYANNRAESYTEYDEELNSADSSYIYSSGEYEVGKDMPAGEYVVLGRGSMNGSGLVSIYEDAEMTKKSIGYDSLSWFDYNTIIVVKEGQWVKLSHGMAYYADKVNIELNPYSHSGVYKVGRDIPVGKYKLVQDEEDQYVGNYEIYSDITANGPVIKDSGRFESQDGGVEIELSEGDYLYTKFCHVQEPEESNSN